MMMENLFLEGKIKLDVFCVVGKEENNILVFNQLQFLKKFFFLLKDFLKIFLNTLGSGGENEK
jgi:hypothetical protein